MNSVTCPYCGLPTWSFDSFVSDRFMNNPRFFTTHIILCKCSNCGKMFYLAKTRLRSITYKMEDIDLAPVRHSPQNQDIDNDQQTQ